MASLSARAVLCVAGLAVSATVITACSSTPASTQAGSTSASAAPSSPKPASSNPASAPAGPSTIDKSRLMSSTDTARIDSAAEKFLASTSDRTPGLWLAVWDPAKGYYEQAYGEAIAGAAKAQVGDHNYVGSITKTVFATAILEQVAAGRLALADTVKDLDPQLAAAYPSLAPITVANLLSMTSGLPNFTDAAITALTKDPSATFTRDQLITMALDSAEQKPVGTGAYSDTNYIVLGKVVRTVTGRSPEELVNDVFAQAGMSQSGLPVDGNPVPEPASHGYAGPSDAATLTNDGATLDSRGDVSDWSFSAFKENGGAYATIGDLATWGGLCLGTSLLPSELASQRVKTSPIDLGEYGLGIFVEGPWLSHAGIVPGRNARVACNPDTGAVVALMANSWTTFPDMDTYLGEVVYPDYYAATHGG